MATPKKPADDDWRIPDDLWNVSAARLPNGIRLDVIGRLWNRAAPWTQFFSSYEYEVWSFHFTKHPFVGWNGRFVKRQPLPVR